MASNIICVMYFRHSFCYILNKIIKYIGRYHKRITLNVINRKIPFMTQLIANKLECKIAIVTRSFPINIHVNIRTYLPRPRMPLAPLARQSKRSFSIVSVTVCTALWHLLIISISFLVVAL